VLKFASQHNTHVLVNHYLGNVSSIDGAANFLGMELRTDLAEDFLSATMRRNPGLCQTLPARVEEELKKSREYVSLEAEMGSLTLEIESATSEETRTELKAQRKMLYDQRRGLKKKALEKHQEGQKLVYDTLKDHEQGDWRQAHFDRICHVLHPARRRLARTIGLTAWPRSPVWISALEDLVALRNSDCSVAYQDVLRPVRGKCPVPSCRRDMKRCDACPT